MTEVRAVLNATADRMRAATGVPVRYSLDQRKMSLDIIVPKFVLPYRLEQYTSRPRDIDLRLVQQRATDARNAAVDIVAKAWRSAREANPDLWTYEGWYSAHVSEDSRELSEQDFAERMRRKRDGKLQAQAAPPEDEGSVSIDEPAVVSARTVKALRSEERLRQVLPEKG